MLTSVLLRFIARNVDSIVAFINRLDQELDAFMARHDAEVAGFEADIRNIEAEAAKKVRDLEQTIEDKLKAAATVAALKAVLPTSSK